MYQRVLTTLDGSALARAALPHVAHVVQAGSQVYLLTVIPDREALRGDLAGSAYEFLTSGQSLDDLVEATYATAHAEAVARLADGRRYLAELGIDEVERVIAEGLPGNEILNALEQHGCDAIVMGTRGHGGLGREVLGSVAEFVLRHAGDAAVVLVGPRAIQHRRPG
jgi:nucleotide-binding universal stress UspA family protein